MLSTILSIAGLVLMAALIATIHHVVRAVRVEIGHPEPVVHQCDTAAVWSSLEALEKRTLEELTRIRLAVAEGIERVDRAEKRVQKTVTSARKIVKESGLEHAGIEAEAAQLHDRDESGSGPEPLPLVQEELVLDGPTGIPGVSRVQLAALQEALDA